MPHANIPPHIKEMAERAFDVTKAMEAQLFAFDRSAQATIVSLLMAKIARRSGLTKETYLHTMALAWDVEHARKTLQSTEPETSSKDRQDG